MIFSPWIFPWNIFKWITWTTIIFNYFTLYYVGPISTLVFILMLRLVIIDVFVFVFGWLFHLWLTAILTCTICLVASSPSYRWELSVLYYHKIMVIYPYPFLVVITQLFSRITCIHDCICILKFYLDNIYSWLYMLYKKLGVMIILQIL